MTLDRILNIYKAVAEESRLRLLGLIRQNELTVSELTRILGQSQPRVSRHLKILTDAGLIERYREGAWVFYRLSQTGNTSPVVTGILAGLDAITRSPDRLIARDQDQLAQIKSARADIAGRYFRDNAEKWDEVRVLHIPDSDIDVAMREMIGSEKIDHFIDLGTGTGRMLIELADLYTSGCGYDLSKEMLAIARTNLDAAGLSHAQVRLGDLFSLPLAERTADLVCLHQVLHYMTAPAAAVHAALRLLAPGGRLIICDFASHDIEFLRESHAHRRLGFSDEEVTGWVAGTPLKFVRAQSLMPANAETDRLTVKIWLFSVPSDARNGPSLDRELHHDLATD